MMPGFGFCYYLVILIFVGFIQSGGSLIIPEYIMNDGLAGDCGSTITIDDSVFVKSHLGVGLISGISKYDSDQNCNIVVRVSTGHKILVQYQLFDLQPQVSSQCVDRLTVHDGSIALTTASQTQVTSDIDYSTDSYVTSGQPATTDDLTSQASATEVTDSLTTDVTVTIESVTSNDTVTSGVTGGSTQESSTSGQTAVLPECGKHATVSPFMSSSNVITLEFVTDSSTESDGFSLLLTKFRTGTCSASEFSCDGNRCIPETLKCDGLNNCVDDTDESKDKAGCTFLDQLYGEVNALGTYAVLGIAVLGGGIVFTIFLTIMMWKLKCRCGSKCGDKEAEDNESEISLEPGPSSKPPPKKPKKAFAEKKGMTPVEEPRLKVKGKNKVEPMPGSVDPEW